MKNYLIVSEHFIGGGLETRVEEQVRFFNDLGINCFLVAQNYNKKYDYLFKDVYTNIDFSLYDNNFSHSLDVAVNKICDYCAENGIGFIDCHPFNSLLPSVLAAKQLSLPVSYTIHGKQSLFYRYGQEKIQLLNDIALLYGVDVLNVVSSYLKDQMDNFRDSIIVKNGVVCDDRIATFKNSNKWAIISRLDEKKTELIINSLHYLDSPFIKQIDIIGDGNCANILVDYIKKNDYDKEINIIGWIDDIPNYLVKNDYDGVIGMGRVLLEAMSLNIPCVMLSYGGIAGIVDNNNYKEFSKYNFAYYSNIDKQDFSKELINLYSNQDEYGLKKNVEEHNNSNTIWKDYLSIIGNIKTTTCDIISNTFDVIKTIDNINENELFNKVFRNSLSERYNYVKYINKRLHFN